jgi:hypothetical protein
MPSASRSWKNSAVYFSAIFQGSSRSLRAASSILSAATSVASGSSSRTWPTSVMFMTCATW